MVGMNRSTRQTKYAHPNRLSLAFISKLTGNSKKEARTPISSTKLTKPPPPPVELQCFKERSTSTRLERDFHAAVLAEPPTEEYLILENKYPGIRALRTDADIGDGLWLCCHCRHENILRHYKGPHPFRHLRCNRCNRVLCANCHTSEILSPLPYGLIHAPQSAGNCEVRYCHICSRCGLSHRAEMEGMVLDFYGVICAGCGISSYGDWNRYHIGNNEPYRRDPDETFAKLIDQRADDAARLAFRWVVANSGSSGSSSLSGKNLG